MLRSPRNSVNFPLARSKNGRDSGFALIIALSLMAFILLLCLSFVALSRVETKVAATGQEQALARENAMLGLSIALGQLQKNLGPDQRTTTRADLYDSANANGLTTAPGAGQSHWLAAWGNGNAGDYSKSPSQIANDLDTTTGSVNAPRLLNWLVSGNEGLETYTVESDGAVQGTSNPVYSPGVSTTPTAMLSVDAFSDDLKIANQPARLLVGAPTTTADDSDVDYVIAPAVEIEASEGGTAGRYAYWVGDEGMKARVNLEENYQQQSAASDADANKVYSFLTSQRAGIEMMDATGGGAIGASYTDIPSEQLGVVSETDQLRIASESAGGDLQDAIREHFHDMTAFSSGVLADTYAGGLKKELMAAINGASGAPVDSDTIFPAEGSDDFGLPTWGQLRSYLKGQDLAQIYKTDGNTAGRHPVIAFFSFGVGFSMDETSHELLVRLYPFFGLWNPYDEPLPAATYDVGFAVNAVGSKVQFQVHSVEDTSGNGSIENNELQVNNLIDSYDFSVYKEGTRGSSGRDDFFSFKVTTEELAPGTTILHHPEYDPDNEQAYTGSNAMLRADRFAFKGTYCVMHTGVDLGLYTPMNRHKFMVFLSPADMNGDPMQVVLAPEDGLDTQQYFQVVDNVRMLSRESSVNGIYAVRSNGNLSQNWRGNLMSTDELTDPINPRAIFKFQTYLEGRGQNSHCGGMMPLRWLSQSNPRAPLSTRTEYDDSQMSGNITFGGAVDMGGGTIQGLVPIALADRYDEGDLARLNTGRSNDSKYAKAGTTTSSDTYNNGIFFEARHSGSVSLMSLGQLQQAPFSQVDAYPSYAFGNSEADFRLGGPSGNNRHLTYESGKLMGATDTTFTHGYYDISWHVNRMFWDRFFVSTFPNDWKQQDVDDAKPLPNARIRYHEQADGNAPDIDELNGSKAYKQAAANLMLAGSFNINSTSEQAWRAILSGGNQLAYTKYNVDTKVYETMPLNVAMPRISTGDGDLYAKAGSNQIPTHFRDNRELLLDTLNINTMPTELEVVVNALAKEIVEEVKMRGPFLSMADFVNRRLVNTKSGLHGVLQAAINQTYDPDLSNPYEHSVNHALDDSPIYVGDASYASDYDLDAYRADDGAYQAPHQRRSGVINKMLSQADMMSSLGPGLSARSDTFVIRAYGETLNPVTNVPAGRAWCEAIVQRLPEYVDDSEDATLSPGELVSSDNLKFGRQFTIVHFRWLSAEEI
ncbi:hypothetical protein [Coraliomargarita parva]|uniref:hypothetical protein n=1 Tax=Coraliomargarita parva TaxID=3014050 RepID=UPI0022B5804F|nr:hypothetical protein [Coraliomargarita parva]